jgi:hypothetical protein
LKRVFFFLSALSVLILVLPNVYAVSIHPVAYPLITAVTLDGKYTSASEWNDTVELPVESGIETLAYFRAKYDSNYLYTLWDFVECRKAFNGNRTSYENQIVIYFDPLSLRSKTPDPSMYRLVVPCDIYQSEAWASHGSASGGWTNFALTSIPGLSRKVQYTSSPHSAMIHMIMELNIPLTFADLKSHMQGTIGFALDFYDGRTGYEAWYPSEWNYQDPSTMGTLQYSQVAVPEFSPILVMSISLVTLYILTMFRKRMRKT